MARSANGKPSRLNYTNYILYQNWNYWKGCEIRRAWVSKNEIVSILNLLLCFGLSLYSFKAKFYCQNKWALYTNERIKINQFYLRRVLDSTSLFFHHRWFFMPKIIQLFSSTTKKRITVLNTIKTVQNLKIKVFPC